MTDQTGIDWCAVLVAGALFSSLAVVLAVALAAGVIAVVTG